jgi:fibro-slime domain-containing protein
MIPTIPGGPVDNPCDKPDAPPNCMLEPSGPACGDGRINLTPPEACDDGNTKPGDGCTGTCVVETDYECPTPGMPCVSTVVCGDGTLGRGEACDDANTRDGDGCSANCRTIEPHYVCRTPAMPCVEVHLCGDGRLDSNEGCDDGGRTAGDGCSARCQIELGWKCMGSPSTCEATMCGDGVKEGAESCDDRNQLALDGCSPDCRIEPTCPNGSGTAPMDACMSSCGDGIVLNEDCDDGNLRSGDGCSATCAVEDGFECDNDAPCEMVNGVCSMNVPAVFRDVLASQSANGHPDFQPGYASPCPAEYMGEAGNCATTGLVQPYLSGMGKPQLSTSASMTNGFFHGAAAFNQWYTTTPNVSTAVPGQIRLWDNLRGGFVNRWGANGEQWKGYPVGMMLGQTYPNPQWCSSTDCTDPNCATVPEMINGVPAPPGSQIVCLDDCYPNGSTNTDACFAAEALFDGNPLFFPIDAGQDRDPRRTTCMGGMSVCSGKVPEQYGWNGWPWETQVGTTLDVATPIMTATAPFPTATHNFHFTTEVKSWFKYDPETPATLDFTGDDDVWVFVNGRLTIDLGGWHVPMSGTVTLANGMVTSSTETRVRPTVARSMTSAAASAFGLEAGNVYQIAVFHAERQTEGSSFKLTLSGFNMTPSDCRTNCGDGEIGAGEECDDGPDNLGGYNQCTADCRIGPHCGDAVVQMDGGEACDDGMNLGEYGVGCGPNCQPSPFCGDGVVQPDHEACDDGTNLITYGGCAPGCVLGPYCGDGLRQIEYEECDDQNNVNMDGCSSACKLERPVTR